MPKHLVFLGFIFSVCGRALAEYTRALHKSTLVVTELKFGRPNVGRTAPIPREDAYLIALPFLPCHDHDLYFDGRLIKPMNWFPGATSIYDLRLAQ